MIKYYKILINLLLLIISADAYSVNYFIENKGQWNQDVLFATRIKGMNAWIMKDGVVFDFYKTNRKEELSFRTGHVVAMHLVNANSGSYPLSVKQVSGYHNYFMGNDNSKWQSNVRLFEEAIVEEVYPGIAIRYYFENGFLRYDFILKAEADPTQIAFQIKGCNVNVDQKQNALVFQTQLGDIRQQDLLTYQTIQGKKKVLKSNFQLKGEVLKIDVKDYDPSAGLVIDPLIFSTFIGGEAFDNIWDMKKDAAGNLVVCGTTPGFGFPTTTGAYSTEVSGSGDDAFISKLSSDGAQLLFSSFLGGERQELCQGLAIKDDEIFIVGSTVSDDLPVTPGAFDETFNVSGNNNNFDIFISKFNASGSALIYSTYLGGTGADFGRSIDIDEDGNAYITGSTRSSNFPTTTGAYNVNWSGQGWNDAFVTKINPSGSQLIYSTYVGGNNSDGASKIALGADRSVFVIGTTFSSNFPTTPGSIQTALSGNRDAFVFHLNPSGSSLIYSTFLGGNELEDGISIAVDNDNNAYVTGMTRSVDFPVTPNAFDASTGGEEDVFISKLNPAGTAFLFSAVMQGNARDVGHIIELGSDNTILLAGESISSDFRVSPGAYATELAGSNDAFIAKISNDGSNLIYCTFFGGNSVEIAYAVADDGEDKLIIAGVTGSSNLPITNGAFNTSNSGFNDGFISKISLVCHPVGLDASSNSPLCAGQELILSGLPSGMFSYAWSGPNNFSNTNQNATISNVSSANNGPYIFTAIDGDGCEGSITLNIQVTDINLQVVQNENALVAEQEEASYQWLDCNENFTAIVGAQSQEFALSTQGSFAAEITFQGCKDTTACFLVTGLNDEELDNVKIYPNPANDVIYIQSPRGIGQVKLFDLNGKLLRSESFSANCMINISDLSTGIYLVQVLSDRAVKHTKLVIK